MDTTTLLVVIVLIAVLIIVIYLLRRGTSAPGLLEPGGGQTGGESRFAFAPSDEAGRTSLVRRRVSIVAPDQVVDGRSRKLVVEALPLPEDPKEPPPPGKGIDRFIGAVIHPRVRYADTLDELTDFNPPLTISVNYLRSDAGMSEDSAAAPKLSLITYYRDGEVWRWQRLETIVDAAAMTCTAKLETLTPADPVGMGNP